MEQNQQEGTPELISVNSTPVTDPPMHPVLQLALAVASKARYEQERFRGHVPRGIGARAYARGQGFDSMSHMLRAMAARQAYVKAMQAEQAAEQQVSDPIPAAVATQAAEHQAVFELAEFLRSIESPVRTPMDLLKAEQDEWNAKVTRRNQRFVQCKAAA